MIFQLHIYKTCPGNQRVVSIAPQIHFCDKRSLPNTRRRRAIWFPFSDSNSATDACTVWRHSTFPTTSRASPTPTAAVFDRRHPRSWWFDVHGCPPSAIEHFRWLIAASGTVCRLTLPQLQRWLFFGIASKLSFSPNHFLINCFPFLVLYAAYCSGLAVLYLGHSK